MLSNLPLTIISVNDDNDMRIRATFEYWQEAEPFARETSTRYPDHVIVMIEEAESSRWSTTPRMVAFVAGETVDIHAAGIGIYMGAALTARTRSGPVDLAAAVKAAAAQTEKV